MLRIALKTMSSHKRRLLGTASAVLIGVAFLAATLVFGDTTRGGFSELFTQANEGTDAVVRSSTEIGSEAATQRGLVDVSLADTIREVDGVSAAEPMVEGIGQIVGADGDPLGGNGPPTTAGNWVRNERLNPYRMAEGRPPEAPGEVAIDRGSLEEGDLRLGGEVTILVPQPTVFRIVGVVTFGDEDNLSGVTFAALSDADAQRFLVPAPNLASGIVVAGDGSVSDEQLVERIAPVLPAGIEGITGAQLTDENNRDIGDDFLDFFETFLLVFAGIALLVSTFSIYNTFSILVAQRGRESALLRAVGASRRQVLAAVAVEALVIGAVASVLGLAAGVALAAGLQALAEAADFGLPFSNLSLQPDTIIVSLGVGMVVTFVASVFPAIRASRVPPLAALRDVSLDRTGASRARTITGTAFLGIGVALVLSAIASNGDALGRVGLGGVATIVGVVVLGPVIARPVARVLGAPLPRLRGVTGSLARQNAMRNPRRTAGTASALMVGVAVVTLFTVFAASFKEAVDDTVSRTFGGDLVIITNGFSGAGLSPQLSTDLTALPEVETAVGLGTGTVVIEGENEPVAVADPGGAARLLDLDVVAGELATIGDDGLAVSKVYADDNDLKIGDAVEVGFADGQRETVRLGAIYEVRDLTGDVFLPRAVWEPHATQRIDLGTFIELASGVDPEQGRTAVEAVADRYNAPDVQDREEYIDSVAGQIDQFLAVIYVLLALAIIIALMGIANTLSLSIHERTRELGLLRAVGQTRRQVRSMIRWESVLVALFGTITGVLLGVFLAWGVIDSVSGSAEGVKTPFTIPSGQLVTVIVIGALAGILAALRPARRGSRLNVLDAIVTD